MHVCSKLIPLVSYIGELKFPVCYTPGNNCFWVSNQGWAIAHSLICSSLISALFKRAIVRLLAQSLFKKEWMSDPSFCRSLQKSDRAIAPLLLFWKEQMSDRSFRSFCCSFQKSDKKSDRSFSLSKRAKEQKWAVSKSFIHFSLKNKSDRSFSKWANVQPCIKPGGLIIP